MRTERRRVRELALQLLFQVEVGQIPLDEVLATAKEQMPENPDAWGHVQPREWEFLERCTRGVEQRREELDGIIARLAARWALDRIASVDRVLLRIALYELLTDDAPAAVVVNAAIEIAKKYSTEESGRFINGILGAYLRERQGEDRGVVAAE